MAQIADSVAIMTGSNRGLGAELVRQYGCYAAPGGSGPRDVAGKHPLPCGS